MRLYLFVFIFFFFSSRRRHTRFDCDWSSDVCSSDLKDTAKIVEIRDKYVGLFQETLASFNRTFPQTPGLRAFTFGGAEDFEPLKRSLRQRVDHVNAVMTQYASMPMPLSMVGKALSLSDVETWEALASGDAGQPVHVGLGSPEALQKYATLAEDTSPLALET